MCFRISCRGHIGHKTHWGNKVDSKDKRSAFSVGLHTNQLYEPDQVLTSL